MATDGPDELIGEATRLRAAGRFDEALAAYRRAVAAYPDSPKAVQHMGALLGQLGRPKEAEAAFRRTLELAPGDAATRHSLAGMLMAQGRYPEAWVHYAARFEVEQFGIGKPDLPYPQWRSWHPAGRRILVFPEQGFGDQIQFARFVPWLVERGAAVTLLALPPLERLFAASFPAAQVIAAAGAVEFPDPDFWVMSSDLPGLAGITPETIPAAPYLVAGPPPPLPPGFKVGLMTQGNPKLIMNQRRSLPSEAAARLRAALPGTVIGLAPEESGARDFAETAAIVAGLDLVVTVDTSVAHLAGALGKICLVLLRSFAYDWRWGTEGDTTPWYPSLRLYRGGLDGGWDAAIDRLAADVGAFAAAAA